MPPPGDPPTFSTKVPPTLLTARRVHPAGPASTGCAGGRHPAICNRQRCPGWNRGGAGRDRMLDQKHPTPPLVFPTVQCHRTVRQPPWKLLCRRVSAPADPQWIASKVDVGEAYDFWLRGRVWERGLVRHPRGVGSHAGTRLGHFRSLGGAGLTIGFPSPCGSAVGVSLPRRPWAMPGPEHEHERCSWYTP
jgi:hypothetical protein